MKLSIIVPFHKGVHFLEDCLESIRDQGLTNFETVLVLDHAKEYLTGLISEYKDINITVKELKNSNTANRKILQEDGEEPFKNLSGVAAARNAGLDLATGEYVYFLDSDDYILNGSLPQLLKEAEEQDADFTYGNRTSTWFQRRAYLASMEEINIGDAAEEQDPGEDNESELKTAHRHKRFRRVHQVLKEITEERKGLIDQRSIAYDTLFASRKGLRNVSVLGVLFRRSFLEEHEIRFHEGAVYFSDLAFMVHALEKSNICSYVEEAVYVKRKHNDPIHYPALSQTKTDDRFEEYISAYRQARDFTGEDSLLRRYLEEKLVTYFSGTYAPRLRRGSKQIWQTNRFKIMQSCMSEVNPKVIKALRGYKKRMVKALLNGNIKKVTLIVSFHLGYKKLKKILISKIRFCSFLYHKLFLKMPMRENWVLCESFFGKSYSDNPKYIYEYLCENYPGKYRFIWVINHRTKIPYQPTKVRRFSIRYCYYLACCKYHVFNVKQPEWVIKREGNVFLQTWNGTPLKKLVFDQEEVKGTSPLYKVQFYRQSRQWDYLVSANDFSSAVFRSAFLYDKEILKYGYPKNDILHSANKEKLAAEVKKRLHIPLDKKIILYAPVQRNDELYGKGEDKLSLKLDLKLLKKELGKEYIVLLWTRNLISSLPAFSGLGDFVQNVSKYEDNSELFLISDLLITDYSSIFFDYANLKKPILFFIDQLNQFRELHKNFYLDLQTEVPGPLLYTSEEVVEAIQDIDDIRMEYSQKYEEFYYRFCSIQDGHAAEKVAKRVFNL